MILLVLKSSLKQSKIKRQTCNLLIYSAVSLNLKPPTSNPASESLLALQADFNPSQIKQVLQIIAARGPNPGQQQERNKALLVLLSITKKNADIQEIITFEDGFN
ncbi:hypothetical protein PtB15_11B685 [Puccinia triticina]|nr:hypothetical protein PtB15_11B685 [Puccinia triticina]